MDKSDIISKLENAQKDIDEILAIMKNGQVMFNNDYSKLSLLELIAVKKLWNRGYKGKGIKIGIIDVGFKTITDKLIFSGKVNVEGQFKESYGHGTEVASIIKGIDTGIAPECNIYVCSYESADSAEQVIKMVESLKWCIENKMDIVNMSIGINPVIASLKPEYEKPLKQLEEICKEAEKKGIIIVCSVGNNGYKEGQELTEYPGAYESTICVGSVDKNNNWSKFSSTGNTIDFVCYGEGNEVYTESGEIKKVNGTSYSAPIMTGIIALMLQQRNDLKKRDIINILKQNAIDLGSIGKDHAYGYGLIKAVEVPKEYILLNDEDSNENEQGFLRKQLNVIKLNKAGITGKNIKIGLVGYGCSNYTDYNVYFYKNFAWDYKAGEIMSSAIKPQGDIIGSAVLSKSIGLCPETINYVLRDRSSYGGFAKEDSSDVNNWCLQNKDKLDIVLVFPYTPSSVIKALSDAGIICVMCCYDNSSAAMQGMIGQNTSDENAITVGFIGPDKNIINDSNFRNNGYANPGMDCVGFAYGFEYRTDDGAEENPKEVILSTDKSYAGALARSMAAAVQAMAVIALMRQQLPKMNNAKKVRKLLPYICEELYGGKNNNTGYGLIRAADIEDLNLPDNLFD